MAHELQAFASAGLTLYAVLLNASGKVWNGSAFVTIDADDWTAYDIAMTEATAGIYLGDMPTVDAGSYTFIVYQQAGATPAVTDDQSSTGTIAWDGTGTTVPSGATRYVSLTEFKTRFGVEDTVDDTTLEQVLDATSRGIDNYCGRHFYQTAAGTVRYYTSARYDRLRIDDCVSLSAVASDDDGDRTYENTWESTDYDLWPENAATDGWPYDRFTPTPLGNYDLPATPKGLQLTGVWGWPAVPDPVHEACYIQASRVFKRKDAPFGIAGSPDLGMMRLGRLDPDVLWMLDPYKKLATG